MSESKDGWFADPEALVGSVEPANDLLLPERGPATRGPATRGPGIVRGGAATTEVISRKEQARLMRRQAYQRAKLLRAADPRHLALKEALKQRRRDVYQQVKAKRKAAAAEQKSAAKAARAKQRDAVTESLMQRVKRGANALSTSPGRPRRPV